MPSSHCIDDKEMNRNRAAVAYLPGPVREKPPPPSKSESALCIFRLSLTKGGGEYITSDDDEVICSLDASSHTVVGINSMFDNPIAFQITRRPRNFTSFLYHSIRCLRPPCPSFFTTVKFEANKWVFIFAKKRQTSHTPVLYAVHFDNNVHAITYVFDPCFTNTCSLGEVKKFAADINNHILLNQNVNDGSIALIEYRNKGKPAKLSAPAICPSFK